MSNIPQIITRQGTLSGIPAGRRVRIDPSLRAPSAIISPASVGDPDFQTTDSPPLAPDEVTVNTGFKVTDIVTNTSSALFGCFYVQNITEHPRDLEWEATWNFTKQQDINQALQTTVGDNGQAGGSPAGVDPTTIQGTAVLSNSIGTAGVTRLLVPGAPYIEEINNKVILLEPGDLAITLPALGADQEGLELTLKNYSNAQPVVTATGATIDVDGYPKAGPNNQYTFQPPAEVGPSTIVMVYNNSTQNWVGREHYHWTAIPEEIII